MTSVLGKLGELIGGMLGKPRGGVSPFAPGLGPARVLVMRHGEKTGEKSDPHLSPAGAQRATALAMYIPEQFGTPDFLIAAANSERSRRPRETLEPLASKTGLPIVDRFGDKDFDGLVEHLSQPAYSGKSGVISWRHSDIPPLAAALGAAGDSVPQPWPDEVFNLIIEITYAGTAEPRVRQIIEPF
jgi:hypothetical protein